MKYFIIAWLIGGFTVCWYDYMFRRVLWFVDSVFIVLFWPLSVIGYWLMRKQNPNMPTAIEALKEIIRIRKAASSFEVKRDRIRQLEVALKTATDALARLSKCGGGCDGPLGCSCKSGIARDGMDQIKEILK